MGTAASAKASEAVFGATAADLQAALDQLPEEDRAKLKSALAAAQAPTEAAAKAAAPAEEAAAPAGEAAAEAAAPAEEAAAAAAVPAEAASGEAAPFLAEYFDKAQARTEALIGDEEKLMALALNPDAQKQLKEESVTWFQTEAKPLLEKSFKHHDTKGTDVLDKEEAAVFFSHLVSEETDFAKAMSALTIEVGIKMSVARMEGLSQEAREELKPIFEKQMKDQVATAKAEVQKKEDRYKADKASHDAAAMKVLDTNKDGTIQLAEFLAAFEPENEKNIELHVALGYLTEEEVKAQQKSQEEAKAEAPGCAQQ